MTLVSPATSRGEVYKWVDENGVTHYAVDRDEIPEYLRDQLGADPDQDAALLERIPPPRGGQTAPRLRTPGPEGAPTPVEPVDELPPARTIPGPRAIPPPRTVPVGPRPEGRVSIEPTLPDDVVLTLPAGDPLYPSPSGNPGVVQPPAPVLERPEDGERPARDEPAALLPVRLATPGDLTPSEVTPTDLNANVKVNVNAATAAKRGGGDPSASSSGGTMPPLEAAPVPGTAGALEALLEDEAAGESEQVRELRARIEDDRALLKQLLGGRDEGEALTSDPRVREIAERLPRLQAELEALRSESKP